MKHGFKSLIGCVPRLTTRLTIGLLLGLGTITELALPRPATAAEEIRLGIGGPLVFSVSVDSLENFAETGEIDDDLRLITRFLDAQTLPTIRQTLQQPFDYSVVQIDNISYSTLGQDALRNVGKIIRPQRGINGLRGLRGAIITAAAGAGSDGWTMIDVLRQYPTRSIDIEVGELLTLQRTLEVYFRYTDIVIDTIQSEAAAAAAEQPLVDPTVRLDQPGPYPFQRNLLTLFNQGLRQTGTGIQINYDFTVETYLPQGLSEPAPVVIISHGFGDIQDSFDFLASHLASHGFAVMIPDHVGSDLNVRRNFLEGEVNTILSPTEFVSRPEEVSFLLDELEDLVATSPEWAARINLSQVGIVGDSLGATTALAIAGADINAARLNQACDRQQFILNLSQYLQCQARFLPPRNRQLADSRIQAAIASHSMGGSLYGPEGIGQIEIPLMFVSGSGDVVAPAVAEQVHPFIWASSEEKYLALMTQGTHFTAKPGRDGGAEGIISLFVGEHRDVGTRYFKALNVAFWNSYLRGQTEFLPYLSARYGEQISRGEPLSLDIIQSLTPETITEAYGQQPPIAIVPEAITDSLPVNPTGDRTESVLTEIERTGVVKVALRQDTSPFGYIDDQSSWRGYCRTFATDLQAELAQRFGTAVNVRLAELVSNQDNRFGLIRDNSAHIECGPNPIQPGLEGITFSTPLLVSGDQFLARRSLIEESTNLRLENVRVAVLPGSATGPFIFEQFPQAEQIFFPGVTGQSEAVRALAAGEIDAIAGAGLLSLAEAQRQSLVPAEGSTTEEYALLPERPLTCEFYGMLLPAGDPEWQIFIDNFLTRTHTERLTRSVAPSLLANQLETVDFCLNQLPQQLLPEDER